MRFITRPMSTAGPRGPNSSPFPTTSPVINSHARTKVGKIRKELANEGCCHCVCGCLACTVPPTPAPPPPPRPTPSPNPCCSPSCLCEVRGADSNSTSNSRHLVSSLSDQ